MVRWKIGSAEVNSTAKISASGSPIRSPRPIGTTQPGIWRRDGSRCGSDRSSIRAPPTIAPSRTHAPISAITDADCRVTASPEMAASAAPQAGRGRERIEDGQERVAADRDEQREDHGGDREPRIERVERSSGAAQQPARDQHGDHDDGDVEAECGAVQGDFREDAEAIPTSRRRRAIVRSRWDGRSIGEPLGAAGRSGCTTPAISTRTAGRPAMCRCGTHPGERASGACPRRGAWPPARPPEATEANEMPRSRPRSADRSALLVLAILFSAADRRVLAEARARRSSRRSAAPSTRTATQAKPCRPRARRRRPRSRRPVVSPPTGGGDAVAAVDDARIVRTGTMQLEVKDVPEARRDGPRRDPRARRLRRRLEHLERRRPAGRGDHLPHPGRPLGGRARCPARPNGQTTKVVTEQTQAVEVTGQVIDLEARIRNLRASETALQAIAAKAIKISDVLDVQAQLTDVRGQIEELTAQLTDVTDRAELATLTRDLRRARSWPSRSHRRAGTRRPSIDEASASMVGILQGLASAGIWFAIVWLPILIVLAVVGGIVVWSFVGWRIVGRAASPAPPAPPAPPATPPAPAAPMASEG